jgi:hypothetical protein
MKKKDKVMKKSPQDVSMLLTQMDEAYAAFIKAPTVQNMQIVSQLGDRYRDAWIIDNASGKAGFTDADSHDRKQVRVFGYNKESNSGLFEPAESFDHSSRDFVPGKEKFYKTIINKADSDLKSAKKDGGSSIITSSLYNPEMDSLILQHSIVGARAKNGKLFNRRWYLEKDESLMVKPWWTDRQDFSSAASRANNDRVFNSEVNDDRIDSENINIIYSDDLDYPEKETFFNEITLPAEREDLLKSSINYVIVEVQCLKSPKQILNKDLDHSKVIWRDVCIYSPEKITFRSFTNDLTYRPSVPLQDNHRWVLSNDMCNTSNQAMIAFLGFTDRGLRINKSSDPSKDND